MIYYDHVIFTYPSQLNMSIGDVKHLEKKELKERDIKRETSRAMREKL